MRIIQTVAINMVDYKNVSPTHDRASSRWPTPKADLSNDVPITCHSPV